MLSLLNWKAVICSSNIELRDYPELKSRGSARRDLVEANWSSIRAVAEELLGKRKLSAVDVKAIILALREGAGFQLTYKRRAERAA